MALDEAGDVGWFWAESPDDEHYQGPCATREEAVAKARSDGASFVGRGVRPDASTYMPDAKDVLEMAAQQADDTVRGDLAQDFPDVTKEAKQELDNLLAAWAEKHLRATWFLVDVLEGVDAITPEPKP